MIGIDYTTFTGHFDNLSSFQTTEYKNWVLIEDIEVLLIFDLLDFAINLLFFCLILIPFLLYYDTMYFYLISIFFFLLVFLSFLHKFHLYLVHGNISDIFRNVVTKQMFAYSKHQSERMKWICHLLYSLSTKQEKQN